MSKCAYLECGYRDSCDLNDEDCVLENITHGQELIMIIRCKSCKNFVRVKGEEGYCRKIERKTNRQWYCGDGKWKG